MSADEQTFVTEDMTFVTVLRIRGINHSEMEKYAEGCRWRFTCASSVIERIMDLLREYNDDCIDVEPREFTKKLGAVRREMYQFLGVAQSRVRR